METQVYLIRDLERIRDIDRAEDLMRVYVLGTQDGYPDCGYAWARSLMMMHASLQPRLELRRIIIKATADIWLSMGGRPIKEPEKFKTLPDDMRAALSGFFVHQAA